MHWKCNGIGIHRSTELHYKKLCRMLKLRTSQLDFKYVRDGIHINRKKISSPPGHFLFLAPQIVTVHGAARLNLIQWVSLRFLQATQVSKLTWIFSGRVYIRGECNWRYEEPSGDLFSGDDLPTPSHCPNSLLGADAGSDVLCGCCEVHQLVSQSTGING